MKRSLMLTAAVLLAVISCSGAAVDRQFSAPSDPAAKVDRILSDIAGLSKKGTHPERSQAISEADLNAYIARQIAESSDKYVKTLELKLKPGDKATGRLVLDLRTLPGAGGLLSGAEVLFAASFESSSGTISFRMKQLIIGTQSVSPEVLDQLIAVACSAAGYPPVKLSDRHDLPAGVKRVASESGRLIIYY